MQMPPRKLFCDPSFARRTAEGGCPHISISLIDFDWFVYQALVGFVGAA
jgi:hypothetical protein